MTATSNIEHHPHDPRIACARTMDSMRVAVHQPETFRAAQFCNPFGEFQPAAKSAFQSIWDKAQLYLDTTEFRDAQELREARNKLLKFNFAAAVTGDGKIEFETYPDMYGEARLYLEVIGLSYHALSSRDRIMIETFPNLRTVKSHTHAFPVLNCPQLNNGASWYNPVLTELYVPEGDWLYMQPRFKHGSTPGDRLTVVVGPDLRAG